jgi:hypothetical protein
VKRTVISFAILGILTAVIPPTDAAPPVEPPGSSILPPGETMVQMLSEFVLMAIDSSMEDDAPLHVYARFMMRNQGEATEHMVVRFPLEDRWGWGDGYGGRPLLEQVSVQVDRTGVATERVEEPWTEDYPPIFWATFPVAFMPGTDVTIEVRYDTRLSTAPDGSEQAQATYILDTGAGWYGPIGSAVVVLRFPYSVGPSNFLLPDPSEYRRAPLPTFVGHEVRWEFEGFEPDHDNLFPSFIWPSEWGRILELETLTGLRPADVDAAIALSQAYRHAGTDRHGFLYYEPLYRLSRQAILQALAYDPDHLALHLELARIELDRCWYEFTYRCLPPIQARIDTIATTSPHNPEVATVRADVEYLGTYFTDRDEWYQTQTAAHAPPSTKTPQPRQTQAASFVTAIEPPAAVPPTATAQTQAGSSLAGTPAAPSALISFAFGVAITLAAIHIIRRRPTS